MTPATTMPQIKMVVVLGASFRGQALSPGILDFFACNPELAVSILWVAGASRHRGASGWVARRGCRSELVRLSISSPFTLE
ncbi:hypothetical protein FB451DRAFT_1235645 [Mycena latifolia]|nr:hypothetical protein FB451DRAFT_1235645 [Mycena latifolia]